MGPRKHARGASGKPAPPSAPQIGEEGFCDTRNSVPPILGQEYVATWQQISEIVLGQIKAVLPILISRKNQKEWCEATFIATIPNKQQVKYKTLKRDLTQQAGQCYDVSSTRKIIEKVSKQGLGLEAIETDLCMVKNLVWDI